MELTITLIRVDSPPSITYLPPPETSGSASTTKRSGS